MRYEIVVVGSINVDLVLSVARHPQPGETLMGTSGVHFSGGKGANQAVAAARLGARTAMVGAVGDDPAAATAVELLSGAGVDLGAVRTVHATTGLAVVTLAEDGENTIIVVPGANATVTPADIRSARRTIAGAGVCVLQAEIPLDSVQEAVRIAKEAGARVVLNVAPAAQLPRETLRVADPLVVNEHEASILLQGLGADADATAATESAAGQGSGSTPPSSPIAAGEDAACRLRAAGVPSVIVTLGSAGAVVVDDAGTHVVPARPVKVVDTTGAGDAFVGALAAGIAAGQGLRDAAAHASRVAAASVQRLGAQASYPWKDEPLP